MCIRDSLRTTIRQVTVNPLRALGLPAPGLSPGAPADLVVLSPDLDVVQVMRAGTWVTLPG